MERGCTIDGYSILYSSELNLGTHLSERGCSSCQPQLPGVPGTAAHRVTAAAAGPGRDGPPAGGGSAGHGGPPAGGGGAGPDDHRAGDLSQEEILDLVVEAMLARGGPAGRTTIWRTARRGRRQLLRPAGRAGPAGTPANRAPANRSPARARDSAPASPLMWRGRGPRWRGQPTVCIPARCGGSATRS